AAMFSKSESSRWRGRHRRQARRLRSPEQQPLGRCTIFRMNAKRIRNRKLQTDPFRSGWRKPSLGAIWKDLRQITGPKFCLNIPPKTRPKQITVVFEQLVPGGIRHRQKPRKFLWEYVVFSH